MSICTDDAVSASPIGEAVDDFARGARAKLTRGRRVIVPAGGLGCIPRADISLARYRTFCAGVPPAQNVR